MIASPATRWRSAATAALCVAALLVSAACSNDSNGTPDAGADTGPVIDAPANEPFGRACDNPGSLCKDQDQSGVALSCVGVQGGAAGKGFCTRKCTDIAGECFGVPNGQWAACALSGQDTDAGPAPMFCAYLCKSQQGDFTCPGTLKCGPESGGQAICVP
ncbi:MAG: hypothetical protein KC503_15855 [Myxococcales bacterium]|nr:hypothetical protein [Myxococcales bacterium]